MSVGDLAAHVRGGELSAREVTTAALERIEALEPTVNAFAEVDADGALAAADKIEPGDERPFAGVPIAIKANVPVAGLTMSFGSKFLADHRPGHSAYLVRRLQEAGFVIVGITNMPEFGILPTTEPRHGGPTRNPWDTERTPGGSSGGAAAAVASGMLPVAHGNDGGGSLRIPASCCGLVGLKPSRGRVSRGPDLGDSYLASDGVLTHSVAETAMLLDVLSGYEVGDATWAPRPAEPYTTVDAPRPRPPADRHEQRQRARHGRRPGVPARDAGDRRGPRRARPPRRRGHAVPARQGHAAHLQPRVRARRRARGRLRRAARRPRRPRRTRSSRSRARCGS